MLPSTKLFFFNWQTNIGRSTPSNCTNCLRLAYPTVNKRINALAIIVKNPIQCLFFYIDYIKSCANLDVCRQLILVFDVNGMGRLKLPDFRDFMASLKMWQTAFKSHTKEKTGILRAERFRDALLDVGFQVNNEVLSALVLRHMRKDGTLRFGDFVSAVLHLTVAFGNYQLIHTLIDLN